MILKQQKTEVSVLAKQADLQAQRLHKIRRTAKHWSQQTFGQPESLLLAFLVGFAATGKPKRAEKDRGDESDGETSVCREGKSRALKALEASFLAWRIIGKPISAVSAVESSAQS